jgi:hypothetical protein
MYVDIVCLTKTLFNTYISIFSSQHFIARFKNLISVPNIRAIIDGTHNTLTNLPNKRITFAHVFLQLEKVP